MADAGKAPEFVPLETSAATGFKSTPLVLSSKQLVRARRETASAAGANRRTGFT